MTDHTEERISRLENARADQARGWLYRAADARGWHDPSAAFAVIPLDAITTATSADRAVEAFDSEHGYFRQELITEEEQKRRHGEEMLRGLLGESRRNSRRSMAPGARAADCGLGRQAAGGRAGFLPGARARAEPRRRRRDGSCQEDPQRHQDTTTDPHPEEAPRRDPLLGVEAMLQREVVKTFTELGLAGYAVRNLGVDETGRVVGPLQHEPDW